MKKVILVFLIFAPFLMHSQSVKEEVELYQAMYGMEKKSAVAAYTQITTESNKPFWIAYDQYEDERKALGQERISLIFDYTQNYDNLNDEQQDFLVAKMMQQRKRMDNLIKKYHKRIKKIAGSKTATKFVQLEAYFLSATRTYIMSNLPMIGEWENDK